MNKGYDTLAGLLEGKVKTKANKTGDLKGRVSTMPPCQGISKNDQG